MAEGLNRWTGLGKLGADPELRQTGSGFSILKFRMACTERYKARSGSWEERTEWVPCAVLGTRAEALSRMLSKGSTVYVEGSFHTSKYEDREGKTRYSTEITVGKLLLVGPKKERAPSREAGDRGGWGDDEPDQRSKSSFDDEDPSGPPAGPEPEDDIPF